MSDRDRNDSSTVLAPAARLLWRSERAVQLELGTHRLLVEGLAASAVASLIGRAGPDADPPATGTPRVPAAVRRQLLGSGFLWPACPPDDDRRQVPPLPRLAGELTALTAAHGADAAAIVAARRHRCVAVHGAGRVGPHLAAVLAGAGVGRVHLLDRGPVRLTQVMPGGAVPADEGTPLAEAAAEAVTRVAPDTDTRPPSLGDRPDLIVLAVDEPVDPDRRAALHRREARAPAGSARPRLRRGRAAGDSRSDQLSRLRRPAPPRP